MDKSSELICQWITARPGTDIAGMLSIGRITRFREALSNALQECHSKVGLQPWAFDVLATLRRQPPPHQLTHGELSGLTMVSNSAITQRIAKLVDRGLVKRVPNPEIRREVYVQLTEKGYAQIEQTIDEHTAICADFMSPLSEPERKIFDQLMVKLLTPRES